MKYRVLKKLKTVAPKYISGEALGNEIGVSRTAVWKYISKLRNQGYKINSVTKRGYKLETVCDVLNDFEIQYNLDTEFFGKKVHYFKQIDSTNSFARKIAEQGCAEGTLIVADSQTKGRGRLGRDWYSGYGKGIFMSLILYPEIKPEDVQIITLAAGIAVERGIEKVTGLKSGIKWPNDLLLKDRKFCGILTEMSSEMEQIHFLVVGIGINVGHNTDDFPKDIQDHACSLKMHIKDLPDRALMIQSILKELEAVYKKINRGEIKAITEEWKKYSLTLGKYVNIISGNEYYTGKAVDITSDGSLIVECKNGIKRKVISGEVSVKRNLAENC